MKGAEILEIRPYDPDWATELERARARLQEALGAIAVRIDPHGSTSVPGLAAKPVIDIQISVQGLQPFSAYAVPLESAGYVHLVHPDDSFENNG